MKINPDYMLKTIAGKNVLIPLGQKVIDNDSIIELNETGAFIFEQLKQEMSFGDLLTAMSQKFDANQTDLPILEKDLKAFIEVAKKQDTIINL